MNAGARLEAPSASVTVQSRPAEVGRRADIQGLRGIAVLSVVLFHAGLAPSGGFLGVDVFFVISGFVVTQRLVRSQDTVDTIDLGEFYRRRIRRLLPALAVMTVVTTAATVLLLSPFGPQQRAYRTGGAATLFSANIELYRTTGYFDDSAALNPFLHTWSLSLEEQVFLVLPLILAAGLWLGQRRWGWRSATTGLVALATIASLFAAIALMAGREWGVEAPARLAFFAMPTRLWEFGAGVLLALVSTAHRARRWQFPMGILGLTVIVVALIATSAVDRHPGPWTVLVVVATAAVISSGTDGGPTAAILSVRPLVFLGDVSYGWYLWHWPALVFCSVLTPGGPLVTLIVALGSLIPAWASHRHLERPIVTGTWWTPKRTWALAATCVLVPLGLLFGADRLSRSGWGLNEPLGWYDYPPSQGTSCHIINRESPGTPADEPCRFGPQDAEGTVMIVGDQLANGVTPAVIDAAAAQGLATVQRTRAGCPFLVGAAPDGYPECVQWQREVIAQIEQERPEVVVVASQANRYVSDPSSAGVADQFGSVGSGSIDANQWRQGLADTLASLEQFTSGVVVVDPIPDFDGSFPRERISILRPTLPNPELDRRDVEADLAGIRSMTEAVAASRNDVEVIDPVPLLCGSHECRAVDGAEWSYLGPVDLTATGAQRLRGALDQAVRHLLGR